MQVQVAACAGGTRGRRSDVNGAAIGLATGSAYDGHRPTGLQVLGASGAHANVAANTNATGADRHVNAACAGGFRGASVQPHVAAAPHHGLARAYARNAATTLHTAVRSGNRDTTAGTNGAATRGNEGVAPNATRRVATANYNAAAHI